MALQLLAKATLRKILSWRLDFKTWTRSKYCRLKLPLFDIYWPFGNLDFNMSTEIPSRCSLGYYGQPMQPRGRCQSCRCSNNSDVCNTTSGVCLNCLFNTSGDHCERCKDGWFGDALLRTCQGIFVDFQFLRGSRWIRFSISSSTKPCVTFMHKMFITAFWLTPIRGEKFRNIEEGSCYYQVELHSKKCQQEHKKTSVVEEHSTKT